MTSTNVVYNALLHLGYGQLEDGLFEVAMETFSAAHLVDSNDERALHGRELAFSRLGQAGKP